MKGLKRFNRAAISLLALQLLAGTSPARTQEGSPSRAGSQQKKGRALYDRYCRSCHGQEARGDSPVAAVLKVAPADLTQLSRRDGEFPFDDVVATIEGRGGPVSGHGSAEWPVWGKVFTQADRLQTTQLAEYLRSIQAESEPVVSEPEDCPDPEAPGVRYVSNDPADCARIRFRCEPGKVPFSNDCGCGCQPAVSVSKARRNLSRSPGF